LEAIAGRSIFSSANQPFCNNFINWLHPRVDWSQIVLDKIVAVLGKSWQILANFGQSVFDWINPPTTWSQFWSLMSQLMWMIPKMLICDLPTFIILMIYGKMIKEIPFLMKKKKLSRNIFGALFFLFFQLPLLIESWPDIDILFFIILIVANYVTAYSIEQNSDISISMAYLALVYLYLLGLWFIPMICFQFAFCSSIRSRCFPK
jgi:hypothetical protein